MGSYSNGYNFWGSGYYHDGSGQQWNPNDSTNKSQATQGVQNHETSTESTERKSAIKISNLLNPVNDNGAPKVSVSSSTSSSTGFGVHSLLNQFMAPQNGDQFMLQSPVLQSSSGSSSGSSMTPSSSAGSSSSASSTSQAVAPRKFRCQLCDKRFMTLAHLQRHENIHTGAKPFECPYPGCDSRFSRNDNCMQHYKTHNNPRGRASRRMEKMKKTLES